MPLFLMPIPIYEHHITVLPSDIDENEHANNLCYLRWMNEAALAHSAENGWPTQRYVDFGASWFARKHTIEYLAPSFEGDKLVVRTCVSDWHNIRSTRVYRFVRIRDDKLIAKAETLWVFVNLSTGKPTRLPREVCDAFVVVDAKDV
ncbi:MAG: acyl-CoA thioesterase [Planctomycetaceae bacterium]|nr:acyl-CoA thioesterase [Planctomycetaceae bacterium]